MNIDACRIGAVTPLYPPASRVGAWLATHEHLAYLAGKGHDVAVWSYMAQRCEPWTIDGVKVIPGPMRRSEIEAWARPAGSVVVGHCGDSGQAAELAADVDRPLVQFWHGGQQGPHHSARLVVYNSESARDVHGWSGPSLVCHPRTDPDRYRVEPTGDAVTLVNCSRAKGVRTLWRVAEAMPQTSFLGVLGGHGGQIRPRARNFETIPTVSDMRDVYRRTRVLAVPSVEESWGMVAVEAMCSGIPVVASPTAGLRESVGDGGVFVHPTDVEGWVRELTRLEDPDEWSAASEAARSRAEVVTAQDPRPVFAAAVEALC